MNFSVIYYIKWSVVAFFSVNLIHSVNSMSVKVVHHCTLTCCGGGGPILWHSLSSGFSKRLFLEVE